MRPDPRQTLDPDNKGYVEADKIRTLLTTHGERFTQEEIDDFLNFAVDAECAARQRPRGCATREWVGRWLVGARD